MTDDLRRPGPDETEPVGRDTTDPEATGGPDQPDRVGPDTRVPTRDEVLQREGADAPDAADIEDPERQL